MATGLRCLIGSSRLCQTPLEEFSVMIDSSGIPWIGYIIVDTPAEDDRRKRQTIKAQIPLIIHLNTYFQDTTG